MSDHEQKSLRSLSPLQRLLKVISVETDFDLVRDKMQLTHPDLELSESLIENSIGFLSIPLGIATHLVIDDVARWIPMAVEETSVIASLSSAAKWVTSLGGAIETKCLSNQIMAQIHVPLVKNKTEPTEILIRNQDEILARANQHVAGLVRRGGGFRKIRVRAFDRPDRQGFMLSVDLFCDPCNAMGANLVTQASENIKPYLAELLNVEIGMAIVSNFSDERLFTAKVTLPKISPEIAKLIQAGSFFAEADPYRAVTHNKGVMNGVDSVLIATGNDWRAVEAAAHAYACRSGKYGPLSVWRCSLRDGLVGEITLPVPCGTVGGVTRVHPVAAACLKIMNVNDSISLGRVVAAVGLIQNLAALKALTTVGLTKGHMSLHAKNLGRAVGANYLEISEIEKVLKLKIAAGESVSEGDASEALNRLRHEIKS